jgi:hypothetical protein
MLCRTHRPIQIAALAITIFVSGAAITRADDSSIDMMNRRIENANQILSLEKQYKTNSMALHARINNLIAQSHTLKGEAEELHSSMPLTGGVKLDAVQLKAAHAQYGAHINEFKVHADAYQAHVAAFRATVGECHANEQAFKNYVNQMQLHMAEFHLNMPDIKPPHVCGLLPMSQAEALGISGQLRGDQQRMQIAEHELAEAQAKLDNERQVSAQLDNKVVKEALRQQKEKELVGEFGKLREEYDLLKTEKDFLAKNGSGSSQKVTRAVVSGKVKQD